MYNIIRFLINLGFTFMESAIAAINIHYYITHGNFVNLITAIFAAFTGLMFVLVMVYEGWIQPDIEENKVTIVVRDTEADK